VDEIQFDDESAQLPIHKPQIKHASARSLGYMRDLVIGKNFSPMVKSMPANSPYLVLFKDILTAMVKHTNEQVAALNIYAQKDVSLFIDQLKACPKIEQATAGQALAKATQTPIRPTEPPIDPVAWDIIKANQPAKDELEDGMYRRVREHDNTIYKVYHTQTGQQVAKRLVVEEMADDYNVRSEGDIATISWKYVGKYPLQFISPDDRMTMADAAEFGRIYGACCICGAVLTNELSIALGIGPICGDREFGGEFKQIVSAAKLVMNQ